jgi:hypothetical protein
MRGDFGRSLFVHMAVTGGDGSDDTWRSKSGARRTTAMVALVGEDERAVLSQKLLTRESVILPIALWPSLRLSGYEPKCL